MNASTESGRLPGWLTRDLPAIVLFVALVWAWQVAVTGLGVREYILPSPLTVLRAFTGSEIPWAGHLWITTLEIVGALLLAGAVGVHIRVPCARYSRRAAREL